MYGLPVGFDASRLIGLTLEQVAFTENTISLWFSAKVGIVIEAGFDHAGEGLSGSERQHPPLERSQLMQLLGKSVRSAEGTADGTLTLRFTNGQTVACYDDNPMYQAYKIHFGDEEIVV